MSFIYNGAAVFLFVLGRIPKKDNVKLSREQTTLIPLRGLDKVSKEYTSSDIMKS